MDTYTYICNMYIHMHNMHVCSMLIDSFPVAVFASSGQKRKLSELLNSAQPY